MSDLFRFYCSYCGKKNKVPRTAAGHLAVCPKCEKKNRIPQHADGLIRYFCNKCGTRNKVTKAAVGKRAKCPECGFRNKVRESQSERASAARGKAGTTMTAPVDSTDARPTDLDDSTSAGQGAFDLEVTDRPDVSASGSLEAVSTTEPGTDDAPMTSDLPDSGARGREDGDEVDLAELTEPDGSSVTTPSGAATAAISAAAAETIADGDYIVDGERIAADDIGVAIDAPSEDGDESEESEADWAEVVEARREKIRERAREEMKKATAIAWYEVWKPEWRENWRSSLKEAYTATRHLINSNPPVAIGVAVVILFIALLIPAMRINSMSEVQTQLNPEKATFFTLTTGALFQDDADRIPPFDLSSGSEAVRAVMFSCGDCQNKQERFVGYLEKYTDDAKQALIEYREKRRSGIRNDKTAELLIQANRGLVVADPLDIEWHPIDSPEGRQIMRNIDCPEGGIPTECRD